MDLRPFHRVVLALVVPLALTAVALVPSAPAVAVSPGTATLSGTVTDSGGAPIETLVSVCELLQPLFCTGTPASVTSGTDGTYSFTGIAGATYSVSAAVPAGLDGGFELPASATVVVAPGATVTQDLALGLGGKVTGQVRLPDGTPVVGAPVSICTEPASVFILCDGAQTDQDGNYLSWRAVTGPTATVRTDPAVPGYFGATTTGVAITPGTTTPGIDLVLDPGGTVSGFVRDSSGTGVSGAAVSVRSTGCNPCTTAVTTSTDGSYSTGAPTGAVTIDVSPPPGSTFVGSSHPVTVTTGATTTLDVTLPRAARINATITAVNGSLGSISAPIVCTDPGQPIGAASAPCVRPDTTTAPGVGTFTAPSVPGGYSLIGVPGGARYNLVGATVLGPGFDNIVSSPIATVDIAPGDVVECAIQIDISGGAGGSASCTGATGTPPGGGNTATLPPAVGGGTTTITSPAGTTLAEVGAVDPSTVGGGVLPAGVSMPFGAYAFKVNGVAPGGSADVTITYPSADTSINGYAKVVGGVWVDASSLIVASSGGSVTLRLVDGGPFDTDPAPGVIGDPGGPAVVTTVGQLLSPVDELPALNSGKAGRTYPVKFTLARLGRAVNELSAVTSIRYRTIACPTSSSTAEDPLETEATGPTPLAVTGDTFHFNWATPRASGCYRLTVTLADGGILAADFKLR